MKTIIYITADNPVTSDEYFRKFRDLSSVQQNFMHIVRCPTLSADENGNFQGRKQGNIYKVEIDTDESCTIEKVTSIE